jgi:hypothetical protein
MVAYCDPYKGWNGWAMPFIREDFVQKLMDMATYEECIFSMDGDNIKVTQIECEYFIEPTIIEGEKYYDFGWEGLCFDFEPLKEDARRQAIIVDIEGLIYDDCDIEPLKLGEVVFVNEYGYNEWQVYVQSQYLNSDDIHGIDTERIVLI